MNEFGYPPKFPETVEDKAEKTIDKSGKGIICLGIAIFFTGSAFK